MYSSVPASLVGSRQLIEIGPMSGLSNVVHWLEEHDLEPRDELVQAIFDRAKKATGMLGEEEVLELCRSMDAQPVA